MMLSFLTKGRLSSNAVSWLSLGFIPAVLAFIGRLWPWRKPAFQQTVTLSFTIEGSFSQSVVLPFTIARSFSNTFVLPFSISKQFTEARVLVYAIPVSEFISILDELNGVEMRELVMVGSTRPRVTFQSTEYNLSAELSIKDFEESWLITLGTR